MDDIESYPNVKKYINNLESKTYADYLHYLKIYFSHKNEKDIQVYMKDGDYIFKSKDLTFTITPPTYIFIESTREKYMLELHTIKSQVRLIRDKLIIYPEDTELVRLLREYVNLYHQKIQQLNELVIYSKHIRKVDTDKNNDIFDLDKICKEKYNTIIKLSESLDSAIIIEYLQDTKRLYELKNDVIKKYNADFIITKLPIITLSTNSTENKESKKDIALQLKKTILKKKKESLSKTKK